MDLAAGVVAALVDLVVVVLEAVVRVENGRRISYFCCNTLHRHMNRSFFLGSIILFCSVAFCQPSNFVYLQTEPAQPFQVKMNGATFSSSQSGYLILSKLTDAAYKIEVSFPSNKWPVQFFQLLVQQMDRGYLLKDFGDKGWGLMDWRSLAIQYSNKETATTFTTASPKLAVDTADFATLLSLAAGDPTLRARTEQKKDTLKLATPLVEKAPASAPVIRTDTVTTSLPVAIPVSAAKQDSMADQKNIASAATVVETVVETITNARCKEAASATLFQETQQSLEKADNDMKRLVAASKYFQASCYSFNQIKQLTQLFKTDEGKYDFLLDAWLYVTNRTHYNELVSVFANPAIAIRFKEMIQ